MSYCNSLLAESPSSVEKVADRVEETSTLPDVALHVIQVANDGIAGAQELRAVLETDDALSASVLRLVNSSDYGLRQRVTDLPMAVAYLGPQQIRNLVLTACMSDVFKGEDELIGTYRRSNLWRHLVAVGVCSRLIAMRCGIENFEDAFLAGLTHDLGIILEDQYLHAGFRRMLTSLDARVPLEDSERREFGFAHTELAARVAERWGFPDLVIAAIRGHHGDERFSGEHLRAVRCVEVANMLCTLKGLSSVGANLLHPAVPAVNGLGLTKPDLEALLIDFDEELARHTALFAL